MDEIESYTDTNKVAQKENATKRILANIQKL